MAIIATHTHHHHSHRTDDNGESLNHPPPENTSSDNIPQDSNSSVLHVSHESHTHFHVTVHHDSHQGCSAALADKPTVRVFTKADPNFSLTIRDGNVILAPSDPNNEYQHWYKVDKYNKLVKDENGCPAFSLVNKVTGEAIKQSIGGRNSVRLVPYSPCIFYESILWAQGTGIYDGYRSIRMVNNIHLNVDAYGGGVVHDGTTIILWKWNNGDNQKWMILPY